MATTFSSLAMRAAAASACLRPSSERCRPRARPGNFTPVVGVRPWRTRRTMVEGGDFLSFIVRSGSPPHPLSPRLPARAEWLSSNCSPLPPGARGSGVRPRPLTLPSPPPGARVSVAPSPSLRERAGVRVVVRRPPSLPTARRVLHRLPDARRGGGALAQHHAELGQRVLDGVHDGGRARDRSALAHALHAERIDD